MSHDECLRDLESVDSERRRAAIASLREDLPSSCDAVMDAMSSQHWQVRASAAAVLDHAEQDDQVRQALRHATRDGDARVRWSAFHALACGRCKPDGDVGSDAVERLLEGMLHDASIRVRRKLAGELMWGQHGRTQPTEAAFRHILDSESDRTLREHAATFLASCELPRDSMPYREWIGAWTRRIRELLNGVAA